MQILYTLSQGSNTPQREDFTFQVLKGQITRAPVSCDADTDHALQADKKQAQTSPQALNSPRPVGASAPARSAVIDAEQWLAARLAGALAVASIEPTHTHTKPKLVSSLPLRKPHGGAGLRGLTQPH